MSHPTEHDESLLFDAEQDAIDRPLVRLFDRYARDHRRLLAIGVLAATVSPLAALLPIYLVEAVIDGILLDEQPFALPVIPVSWTPDDPFFQLIAVALAMVGFALVGAGAAWIGAWAWGRFAQEVQHAVRVDAYRRAQRLEMAFFENEQTGQLISILNDDVNQLNEFLESFLAKSVEISARFAAIVVLLVVLHWQLALVLCAIVPVLGLTARHFVRRLKPKYHAVRQHVGALTARIQNAVRGMATIKSYTREDAEYERVRASSRAVFDRRWAVVRLRAKFFPAMSAVNWCGFGLLLVVGGYWILIGPPGLFTQPLHVGTLVSFMLFSQQFMTPLVQAAHLVDRYYDSRASLIRIFALEQRPPGVVEAPDPVGIESTRGDLELQEVTFGYEPDEPVLENVSMRIEAGQHVGIVGPTGSGKTTLARLFLRFYDPDAGCVRLDGRDVRTLDRRDLRRQFGYVSQQPRLFTGTVRYNVRFGNPEATDAAVRRAAERAHIREDIEALPDGFDTQVGEEGNNLSGGQRQRIALARALVSDAPVLVLDEAMSHVDVETEARIRQSIAPALADRTTIAIAHRLSTVRHADRIFVLEDGRFVEGGTHEELLAEEGIYARLWRMQIGEFPPAVTGSSPLAD